MKSKIVLMFSGMLMVAVSVMAHELPSGIVPVGARQGGFWPSGYLHEGLDPHFYLIENNEDGSFGKYHGEVAVFYGNGDEVGGYPVKISRATAVPQWVCLDGKYLPVMGVERVFERSAAPEVFLHDGIVKIGHRSFAEAEGISQLTLPMSLQSVSTQAFYNMSGLKEIKFRSPLPPTFEMSSANDGGQLLELGGEVPDQIDETPFGTSGVQVKFYVPEGSKEFYRAHPLFKAMKWEVEEYNPQMSYIRYPYGANGDFQYAKSGNYSLELREYQGKESKVEIPSSVAFESFEMGISMLEHPYEVAGIGAKVFYEQAEIKDVMIPEGVKYVKGEAFRGCGVENVEADGNLQFVGDLAFGDLKNLKTFTLNRNASDMDKYHWAATAFDGINANSTLRYYADDVRVNPTELPWSRFSKFEVLTPSIEGSGVEGIGNDPKAILKVIAGNGAISVCNDSNTEVSATVTAADGAVVFEGKISAGEIEHLRVAPGVYVVATPMETVKVII